MVTGFRPICLPFALAFAMPDRTLARIMESSNSLKTPAICKNAIHNKIVVRFPDGIVRYFWPDDVVSGAIQAVKEKNTVKNVAQ